MSEPDFFPDHVQPRLGQIFADELKAHQWSPMLQPFYSRLRATDQLIHEALDGKQFFADALWNLCFLSLPEAELWHYTSLSSLENILRHEEIWLHPIAKRIGEGELTEFASEFGYGGFTNVEADGLRVIDKLARNLFYLSLTDRDDLWDYGEVRLRLRVSPVQTRAHLRQMQYATGVNHPLKVLKKLAQDRFGRHFIPWQVSRNAAFFLDSYFSWESETRLLIKRFDETTDLTILKNQEHDVVAIPLGKPNERVLIDLLHIETDTQASLEKIKVLVAGTALSAVPISLHAG